MQIKRWIFPVLAVLYAVLAAFLICNYTFHLFPKPVEVMETSYVANWRSLLEGRFDIDRSIASFEAFLKDGKSYTYFGLYPAVLRGIASVWIDLDQVGFARFSCWLAVLVFAAAQSKVLKLVSGFLAPLASKKQPFLSPGLILFLLLMASPLIPLLGPAFIFHEALLWGLAWTSVGFLFLLNWGRAFEGRKDSWALPALALCAGFGIFSRPPMGFVLIAWTLLAIMLEFRAHRKQRASQGRGQQRKWKLSVVMLAVFIFAAGYVNHKKFGAFWEFSPMKYHSALLGTARGVEMERIGRFRLDRMVTSAEYYLLPHADNFRSRFPFLSFSEVLKTQSWTQGYDWIEDTELPLSLYCPVLLIVSGFGFFRLGRRNWRSAFLISDPKESAELRRPLWVAFWGATIPVLIIGGFAGLAIRYEADTVPLLVTLGWSAVLFAPTRTQQSELAARLSRWRPVWGPLAAFAVLMSTLASQAALLITKADHAHRFGANRDEVGAVTYVGPRQSAPQ